MNNHREIINNHISNLKKQLQNNDCTNGNYNEVKERMYEQNTQNKSQEYISNNEIKEIMERFLTKLLTNQ